MQSASYLTLIEKSSSEILGEKFILCFLCYFRSFVAEVTTKNTKQKYYNKAKKTHPWHIWTQLYFLPWPDKSRQTHSSLNQILSQDAFPHSDSRILFSVRFLSLRVVAAGNSQSLFFISWLNICTFLGRPILFKGKTMNRSNKPT